MNKKFLREWNYDRMKSKLDHLVDIFTFKQDT
jgi:hypothetical protein